MGLAILRDSERVTNFNCVMTYYALKSQNLSD